MSDHHRRVYTVRDVPLASCAGTTARGSRVLVAASSDGSFLPPFVVFRSPSHVAAASPGAALQGFHPDAYYHSTPTGQWSTEACSTILS